MSSVQHGLFKFLLALCALCIVLVIVGITVMEFSAVQNGGGEMVNSIALLVGLMLVGYYAMVMALGALLCRQASARWGWFLLTVLLALVVAPAVFLWKVIT